MVLLAALVPAFLVFLVRGCRPRDLAQLRFRRGWAILVAVALQLVAIWLPVDGAEVQFRGPLIGLSFAPLLVGLAANWRVAGLKLILAGASLNALVMLANGGLMPVTPEALVEARLTRQVPSLESGTPVGGSKDVVLKREDTRLWVLSDILIWPRLPRNAVFSIGDVLIAAGAFWAIASISPSRRRNLRPAEGQVGLQEYGKSPSRGGLYDGP